MLHPVFAERLLATARKLREIHKKESKSGMKYFDLVSWGTIGFPELRCNSTACATGWATVACPNQGLSLEHVDGGRQVSVVDPVERDYVP